MLNFGVEFGVRGVLSGLRGDFLVFGRVIGSGGLVGFGEIWMMRRFPFEREGFPGLIFFGMFGKSVIVGWAKFFFPRD